MSKENTKSKTLERYLRDSIKADVIDHTLRTRIREDGKVVFYIHPTLESGDTQDYIVEFNGLTTILK